jgi:hypothetical protein
LFIEDKNMLLTRYNSKGKVKCFPVNIKLYEFLTSTLGGAKVSFMLQLL